MWRSERPPLIAIVGKKNSGKTTLLVGVAAELKRRGMRVASVKHGHHAFEIDHAGRDSWRHVHEGGVDAVLLLSSMKVAMVMHTPEGHEPDLEEMVARHLGGRRYDIVLVEGYKHGELPKVEIHRAGIHQSPVYDASDAAASSRFLAIVSDDPTLRASCPVIPIDAAGSAGSHVQAVADLLSRIIAGGPVDD